MARRTRGRFVGLVAVGCALAALAALAACGPGGPSARALADEPVLRPPVDAVELGRTARNAERGWLLGVDSAAVVEVVYAVALSPEQAAQAWVRAYGEQYGFGEPALGSGGQVFGAQEGVGVQLQFGREPVLVVGDPGDYQPVPRGSSVVTIVVNGDEGSESG